MIGFVILHYKNIDITLKCLECLKKIIKKNDKIIIVDNNTLSDNDAKKLYQFTNDIIRLDTNQGFAKANNAAIKYTQKKYDPDYYVVINNDVFIESRDFISGIKIDYKKYAYDVLGPHIDSPSGYSVNPFPVLKTKKEIIKEIKKAERLIKIYDSKLLYYFLESYLLFKHLIKKQKKIINGSKIEKGIALHGCCIVFSKKYVIKYSDPFINDTFLYHEEEFLYKRIIDDCLVSIYDPKLKVFHQEGASSIKKSERQSKLFREKERIKSLKLLLKK